MRNRALWWLAGGVAAILAGSLAWLWLAGGSGEPSTELTTPEVAGATTSTTAAPEGETSTTSAPETSTTEAPPAETAFVVDPERSLASFQLDEELRGSPTTVVGETDHVAGQVLVDPDDLGTARFSQFVINARTFETGSSQRDRAIRGPVILNSASDEFELITFDVTGVEGLEGTLGVGDSTEFQVTGDLTVKGTTRETTFDVTLERVGEATIEGLAEAMVLRSDFEIGIPNVPGVANVSDEVLLMLDFTAVAG